MDLRALAAAVVVAMLLAFVGNQIIGQHVAHLKTRVDEVVTRAVMSPPESLLKIQELSHNAILTRSYLEVFFSESSDMMLLLDENGRVEAVNATWSRLMGYTLSELIGKHWKDFVHPQDIRTATRAYHAGVSLPLEIRVRDVHGHWRWISFSSAQVNTHVVASGRDITDARQMREDIAEREVLFRSLIDLIPMPTSVTDDDGKYVYFNPSFCEFLGYSPEELARLTVFDLTPQEDVHHLLRATEEVRSGRSARVKWSQTFICRDGSRRRCDVLAHGVRIGGHYRYGVSILNAADAHGATG